MRSAEIGKTNFFTCSMAMVTGTRVPSFSVFQFLEFLERGSAEVAPFSFLRGF
jgi:hypothetical protein